ncbi:MAG: hypothetical protein KGJ98_05110 [Chloroflexota bacterium]|nr:hypothetical protein [Chloroflexota bacterium]
MTTVATRWELFREGDALYQEIVENAIDVTGARYVNLSWYDPATNEITGSAWSIRPSGIMDDAMRAAQAIVPGFSPMDVRFSGDANPAVHAVLVEGRALFAPFGDHVRGTVHPAMIRIAQTVMGLRWTHSVPLRIGPAVVGALAYHFMARPAAETLPVAEAFAHQVALTLENVRLSGALRRRAADLEGSRERIAAGEERLRREIAALLHGRVESRLLAASGQLRECRDLARTDPASAASLLEEVGGELDRIREEDVRRASHRLHPSTLSVGLVPALELLAEGAGPHIDVTVETTPEAARLDSVARNALPERLRLGVYRFVEEAVANAARHSGAASARVAVGVERSAWLRVGVSDAGHGFDPRTVREGIGLPTMRDHIGRLGGDVRIVSVPGVGTTAEAVVPLAGAPPRHERRRWPRRGGSASDRAAERDGVLQRIAENALAVTRARFVSLSLYDASAQIQALGAIAPLPLYTRVLAAARAVVPGFDPARVRFAADVNPATREVLVEGHAVLAPLAEQAAGALPDNVLRAATAFLGVAWVHSVPLCVSGSVAGALAFHYATRPPEEKLPVAEAFAKQAALTLENVRLSDALQQRAEELARSRERIASAEERTRREIAELLHGRVQTRLLVATERLRRCRSLVGTDADAARAELAALAAEFDRIREEDVRQASGQLRPAALDAGIVAALRQLAEGLGPHLEVRVEASDEASALDDPTRDELSESVRLGVYRFAEEALANVARHAGVAAATVTLDADAAGSLRASVSDEGRGFDPAAVREGFGLRSMRDRVERLGGALLIQSSSAGTTVTATLPLGRVE